jgi:DNA modification methylase
VKDVEIIQGDCREVMAGLDGIGAVIADPPYGISHSSNYGASWQGTQILNDHDASLSDWIIAWAEAREIPWAVFGNQESRRPEKARGVLIWDKGPAFGMGDLSFPWKASWESIYVGGPGWNGKRDEGVLRGHLMVSWESKGRRHQHQKPVSLISALIAKLPPGAVILDPVGGSGTTAVACRKAGRKCVIIEEDPQYIPVIERRVAEARTPLFDSLPA